MTLDALVIGGGPAGLMAAEQIGRAGYRVHLAEAKPTLARKFLMAGKSGLNLTKVEADFTAAYRDDWITGYVDAFGPEAVQDFARGLGIELFTGSTGRVFPVGMKASPMLRAWIGRLVGLGVEIRTRWCWRGFAGDDFLFDTPQGQVSLRPRISVLALGGASWPRLGSDAAWVPWLADKGVQIAPFRPANMGFVVHWSPHMQRHFGTPVKGATLITDGGVTRGEFVISARGIEGGGIYAVSAEMRDGSPLALDLAPDLGADQIAERLARLPAKESLTNRLRKALHFDALRIALLNEWGRPLPQDPAALAALIKSLPVHHAGPRPIAEAISSAGGIARAALSPDLELRALPGVFAAGEMLDWEAPTGGYLLTACLATGHRAGLAAARHLAA
ncbi:TIGR03862 family flavoprotein [Sedimentimonas flavescens]|uniref:TIGR03862 family flavoprotein n=1 Tax=Sedimentimonas flavescens TaxID=2851012 RepID=A0ABT2ZZN7_9RHOB|nr:TIGR03862 family flavoprotein [Sedimentimonas flavescens]MCV2879175.1 TIGR03862 family flavoprotein [Sedimentimonas flavescens]